MLESGACEVARAMAEEPAPAGGVATKPLTDTLTVPAFALTEVDDDDAGDEGTVAPEDEHGFPMVSPLVQRLLNIDVTEVFSPRGSPHKRKSLGSVPVTLGT